MVKEMLQGFVDQFGLCISKEKLVERAYNHLRSKGLWAYVINEKYIGVDGEEFQFIKSRKQSRWIVGQF